ncbi:MAG: hypothetical protein EZS28_034722 [Streblomastix strix]|uniref:Uncharacterized protein n=1 Tax=Streblomastix strix TaxID=222440 RepID=A0A5J4UIA0_9EUKA|nr:MAG: hypothetical protein EZS28_034722 [Streblomastix strix]
MTALIQQWDPASDDMAWDEKPFGNLQGLMNTERSVPQNIDEANQKTGYTYDLKLIKKLPTRKQIQSDLPAFILLSDKRSRRVGQGPCIDVDEAMKQFGYLVAGKLHRDISKIDRLIHPQKCLRLIERNEI